jgi:hypothetical protein
VVDADRDQLSLFFSDQSVEPQPKRDVQAAKMSPSCPFHRMNNQSLETFIPDRYGKGLPFQVLV